jgi:hypothetical protein
MIFLKYLTIKTRKKKYWIENTNLPFPTNFIGEIGQKMMKE